MNNKSKIKEISMMVYRKYTEDFDSLGFRLGLSVEVKDGDARDSWYQGRLFLDERIKEEESLIKKKFEWLAVKKGKFQSEKHKSMELTEIPKEKPSYVGVKALDVVYVHDIDDAYHRIMFETNFDLAKVKKDVEAVKKMGVTEKEALLEVGAVNGIKMKFAGKSF